MQDRSLAAEEGMRSGGELGSDDSRLPHIGTVGLALHSKLLRRHIGPCASRPRVNREGSGVKKPREAEIDDDGEGPVATAQDDVLRLQVAVHNPFIGQLSEAA